MRLFVPDTSAQRYAERVSVWSDRRTGLSPLRARLRFQAAWWLHNLVAHPLLAVFPGPRSVALHNRTSRLLWPAFHESGDDRPDPPLPVVHRRAWWVVHNLLAHAAIGLAPCEATFRWHDDTAGRMDEPDWV